MQIRFRSGNKSYVTSRRVFRITLSASLRPIKKNSSHLPSCGSGYRTYVNRNRLSLQNSDLWILHRKITPDTCDLPKHYRSFVSSCVSAPKLSTP